MSALPPSTTPADAAAAAEMADGEPSASAAGAPTEGAPSSILVLHNVAKKKNFGELIRTASALGASDIVIVGAAKLQSFGCHGTAGHIRFVHFDKLADAVAYLHNVRGARLCGVEICEQARPVQSRPFCGTTAFLMGNEGQGLTPQQMAVCDEFVYIPQHSDATASLNVNAACAVVLHQFAMWAALPEATRDGYKYVQGAPPSSVPHSGMGLKQMKTLRADGTVMPRTRRDDDADARASGAEDEGVQLDLS
jgi:tRNA G18 (ribose-2'-O)-methylase SpoU